MRTGKPIPKGMLVCHRCDNKSCVRPGHLYIGTPADNSRDAVARQPINKEYKSFPRKGLSSDEKFWIRVNKTATCWEWIGEINEGGYGQFTLQYQRYLAHRWVYEHTYGKFDSKLFVLHTCDNRKCVRPDHLKTGTHADNMIDMTVKGRGVIKLTEKQVKSIYSAYANGERAETIAKRFGVTKATVSNIVHGTSWKHMKLKPIPRRIFGTKMTFDKAEKLRVMNNNGNKTQKQLASFFGINVWTVRDIIHYRSWVRPLFQY
jgi:hypothetical protein